MKYEHDLVANGNEIIYRRKPKEAGGLDSQKSVQSMQRDLPALSASPLGKPSCQVRLPRATDPGAQGGLPTQAAPRRYRSPMAASTAALAAVRSSRASLLHPGSARCGCRGPTGCSGTAVWAVPAAPLLLTPATAAEATGAAAWELLLLLLACKAGSACAWD